MKLFKKIIISLLITLVFSFMVVSFAFQANSPLSKTELAHAISFLINLNKFRLVTSKNIDKKNIRILWNSKLIYNYGRFDNKAILDQRYIYGENIFTIIYNSNVIGKTVQYKFNNYHEYTFYIKKEDNIIVPVLKIIGPDSALIHY